MALTINLGKRMSSKNRLRTFSNASLVSSVALSVSIRTKLSRSSVFAAMSSKMNVVIWNEFSFRRKSLGSSSFLKESKRIMTGAYSLITAFTWKPLLEKKTLKRRSEIWGAGCGVGNGRRKLLGVFWHLPSPKLAELRPIPHHHDHLL